MTFVTALLFLNMGFFLLEVRLLGLDYDPQMMANISKMMAGAAFEEERDCGSLTLNFAEEEYLAGHHTDDHKASLFLISEHISHVLHDGNCLLGYLKKFNPPPEG